MKTVHKKEPADVNAGFRILDVRCSAVDDDTEGNGSRRRSDVPPATPVNVQPLSQFGALSPRGFQHRPMPAPAHRLLPTGPVRSRRKRLAWLLEAIRAERVPLLFALTGIATSAFLAMLFSMIEPRVTAALSAHDNRMSTRSTEDDIGLALAAARFKDGRSEEVVVDNGAPSAAIQTLKRIVIALPALIGLGVLIGDWLLRLCRAMRPTGVVEVPVAGKNSSAVIRAEKPAAAPEQQNKLRRAA